MSGIAVAAIGGLAIAGIGLGVSSHKKNKAARNVSINQALNTSSQLKQSAAIQKELAEKGRPEMNAQVQRNQEIADLAKKMTRDGIPEQAYQNQVQQIERSQENALSSASSRGAGMNAIAGVQGNANQAYSNLGAQDANVQRQNQQGYMSALQNLGLAEGQAEQYNKLLPYEQQMQYAQSLQGAAMQNNYNNLMFQYQNAANNQQMYSDMTGSSMTMFANSEGIDTSQMGGGGGGGGGG